MMQKRSLWAVLFVMLMMALSVNGAVAEDDALRSGDYQYRVLEDGTAEITHYFGRDSVVHIPETLDGKTVTSIRDVAFALCSSLTSIELPDGVTSIGEYAFSDCSSLTTIELPDSVTSIGESAFYRCRSLTTIELPDSVTSIGDQAFAWCRSLTSIELPDSVTSIGDQAFWGCNNLTVTILQ